MNTNELTKEIITNKIDSNLNWLCRGIVAIYEKQTADEQQAETTNKHNNVGFNGTDAKFGSSLAKQIIAGRNLSPKQIEGAKRMMKKYAGQLLKIAKEKACTV